MKVGITDVFPASWRTAVEEATPPGWTVAMASDLSEATRWDIVRGSEVIFCGSAPPTDVMLEGAEQLRFLQKLGAGFDNINVELLKGKRVGLARLAGNNAVAVAEHTVLLMLSTLRRLPYIDRSVRQGAWSKELARTGNRELRGKVVGLVGLGRIGREVARRLAGFEVTIVYFDPVRASPSDERLLHATYLPLPELVDQADILSLHLPLMPDTRGLIDAEILGRLKPETVLINCARGELIDEPALLEGLRSGHLGGAGLDCFQDEGPGGSKAFWDMDNVALTCHIAGVSRENFTTMMQRAFMNAQSFLEGRPLPAEDVIWLPA